MEYLIVLLLCNQDTRVCQWHKMQETYQSFQECVAKGKEMDLSSGNYGVVLKAGCAIAKDADQIPDYQQRP